jgi:hypothetical protein
MSEKRSVTIAPLSRSLLFVLSTGLWVLMTVVSDSPSDGFGVVGVEVAVLVVSGVVTVGMI